MKILLVQLASMGDCLFATAIARQIKEIDYPNCHLTWLIGDRYKDLLNNNPYIDKIITADIKGPTERFKMESFLNPIKDNFDKIIMIDFCPENYKSFYGTTRSAFFRTYGKELKNIEPQIFLTQSEIENVHVFAQENKLKDCYPILLECGPESYQSPLMFEEALSIAQKIVSQNPDIKFIFSSRNKLEIQNPNFIDASSLTYRENAELTKHCKLLLGASSGITWLNTSNWAAKIPMVIVVNKGQKYFNGILSASVEEDFNYWNVSTEKLIEFDTLDEDTIVDCILTIVNKSFKDAKEKYSSNIVKTKSEIESSCLESALVNYYSLISKNDMPQRVDKSKYYRYMILSKLLFGKTKERYIQKYNRCKALYG